MHTQVTGLVIKMDPGPLTGGQGFPLRQKTQITCDMLAGLASVKRAASMLCAVMDLSGVEGGGHNAGPRFAAEPDATCQLCFV